jgi:hypothetical protein
MVKCDKNNPDIYARRGVLDLDGTLNKFIGWTGQYEIYPPLDGAEQFLQGLCEDGWELVLATARPDIEEIKDWLKEIGWDKYFVEVWEKPFGMWYLDDKNVYFDGNYNHAKKGILKLEAWYSKKPSLLFRFISSCRNFVLEFMKMMNNLYDFPEEDYFNF